MRAVPLPAPPPSAQSDAAVAIDTGPSRVPFLTTVLPAPDLTKTSQFNMDDAQVKSAPIALPLSEAPIAAAAVDEKKMGNVDGFVPQLWDRRGAEQPVSLGTHQLGDGDSESSSCSNPENRIQQNKDDKSHTLRNKNQRGAALSASSESAFLPSGSVTGFQGAVARTTLPFHRPSSSPVTAEAPHDTANSVNNDVPSRFPGSNIGTASLSVRIFGMSPLHADSSVVYPFVRVWLVNGVTGENLIQTSSTSLPCTLTHPVDLRAHRTRAPFWDAELILRLQSRALDDTTLNTVLLLEVLEGGAENIQGFPIMRTQLYGVCWGFVKLSGALRDSNLQGLLHVQMFPFPQRSSLFTKFLQLFPSCFFRSTKTAGTDLVNLRPASPPGSHHDELTVICGDNEYLRLCRPPELFFIFRDAKNRKVPYSAGLTITLKRVESADYLPRKAMLLPHEERMLEQMSGADWLRRKASVITSFSRINTQPERGSPVVLMNTTALTKVYAREVEERVVPPTSTLQQVKIRGKVTCVASSNSNAIMAFGVTIGFEHVVQVRCVLMPELPIIVEFCGHVGHIHHVAFRKDGRLLLSCSSDKTVKVWCWGDASSFGGFCVDASSQCICTLAHGFPVYDGFFYQDCIVTCGYDPRIHVWRYEGDVEGQRVELNSQPSLCDPSRNLDSVDATLSDTGLPSSLRTTKTVLGELLHVTSSEDTSIIRAVCGTALNRVWSLDTAGNVVVWRAVQERTKDGKHAWKMTVRHRFKCPGATKIEVQMTTMLITCAKSPVAYVFDDSSCRLLQEIVFHQRPYLPAVTLLPDAEAIVAVTGDGKLLSWESSSGTLCTPRSGYAKTQVDFAVNRLVWLFDQQLAVLIGSAGSVSHATGVSLSHMTLVTVIGTPRSAESVMLQSDPRASDYFRACFGSSLTAHRRRHGSSVNGLTAFRATADGGAQSLVSCPPQCETISGDGKRTRMDQIIAMWKGLVGQHHRKTECIPTISSEHTAIYITNDENEMEQL